MMRVFFAALGVLCLFTGCAVDGERQKLKDLRQGQTGFVVYPSTREPIDLWGELVLPSEAAGAVPAMIIAHGSGGISAANARWAEFLRGHGIATFQIDYFGPRGVQFDSFFQPTPVHDALDAFRLLSTHPKIDRTRIGIIGFSRGANIAVMTANASPDQTGGYGFAAHVAVYPTCDFPLIPGRKGSGAPVLVLIGTRDDLAPVAKCEHLVKGAQLEGHRAVLKVYEGATHGWDGNFHGTYFLRSIGRSFAVFPDQAVTEQSRKDVLEFLKSVLRF